MSSASNSEHSEPSPGELRFDDLIRHAREGDAETRAKLVELFRDYLRNIANANLPRKMAGRFSTSDVVQSAIIDANENFSVCRANSEAEFKAWLRQILINGLLNRFRDSRRHRRNVERERRMESKIDIADDVTGPVDSLIKQEDQQRLNEALAKLTDERRQMIEMRHRDGLSFVEIGKRLDKSPDAVRMLWNRSIEALAKVVSQQDQEK